MTPDKDLSAPQIEWPDEIWAECDFDGGFGIYRTSFFATVDQPCEHAKYVHQGIHDSLKKYHATMVENGQLITLADHERAVQAAVAKAVEAERAECITIADDHMISHMPLVCDEDEWRADEAAKIAAAIRARKGDAP